jgi:hypothetical protein
MKVRAIALALIGLSLLAVAALPALAAPGRLQDTETPPPTVESCLTLEPEDQSDCFATKAAIGEVQRQTQEVIDVTITAQAIEQNIQGTLGAAQASATPVPTAAPAPSATPEGIALPIPGLEDVRLNLASMIGLGVCAVGGIVLVALGIYLVRGSGRDEEEAAGPDGGRPQPEPAMDVRPLPSEPAMPLMPPVYTASAATGSMADALATTVPGRTAPLPPADVTLSEHRMQGAAAPGTLPMLIAGDGGQVRVTSGDFSIGRAFENDFVVDARFAGYENVSAEHARIVQDASQRWLVEDLGSANGTYVNGRPTTMNVLQDGWRLGFGPVEFTFRLIAPEEAK